MTIDNGAPPLPARKIYAFDGEALAPTSKLCYSNQMAELSDAPHSDTADCGNPFLWPQTHPADTTFVRRRS